MKDNVVVLLVLGAGVMEISWRRGRPARLDPERTGHAEMGNGRQPALEMDQQVFGTAAQAFDLPSGERLCHAGVKGKRRSGRRSSSCVSLAPSIVGARPRRTVSTSGSSGTVTSFVQFCFSPRQSGL